MASFLRARALSVQLWSWGRLILLAKLLTTNKSAALPYCQPCNSVLFEFPLQLTSGSSISPHWRSGKKEPVGFITRWVHLLTQGLSLSTNKMVSRSVVNHGNFVWRYHELIIVIILLVIAFLLFTPAIFNSFSSWAHGPKFLHHGCKPNKNLFRLLGSSGPPCKQPLGKGKVTL